VVKVGNIYIKGLQLQVLEKVGTSNKGIVQKAIRLRYYRKHKLKDHKGKRRRNIIKYSN
jgi:hypothetical protein